MIFIALAIVLIIVINTTVGTTYVVTFFIFFLVTVTMVLLFGPKFVYIQSRGFFKQEIEKEIKNLEFELKNKKRYLAQIDSSKGSSSTMATRSIYDQNSRSSKDGTSGGTNSTPAD